MTLIQRIDELIEFCERDESESKCCQIVLCEDDYVKFTVEENAPLTRGPDRSEFYRGIRIFYKEGKRSYIIVEV